MKKHSTLILLLVLGVSAGCKKTGPPYSGPVNSLKRYPFEHFHLVYEFGGDARGTEDVYVSGYGRNEAQYTKSDLFGPQGLSTENTIIITKIANAYSLDFSKKTYSQNHLDYLDSLYHLDESDVPSSQQYLEFEMKRNLMKNYGQDTVAGYQGVRWQLIDGNMSMWTWKGILLRKFAASEQGSLDMRIKSIDTLWTVDSTKFMIPKDFKEVKLQGPNAPPEN